MGLVQERVSAAQGFASQGSWQKALQLVLEVYTGH